MNAMAQLQKPASLLARNGTVLLACLTLVGSLFLAGAKASSRWPELGRLNKIGGAASTRATVILPRMVEIANPTLRESDFRIRSEARFAGFALVHKETLQTWVGGRVKKPRDGQIPFFVSLDPLGQSGDGPESHKLPAGQYYLYLVADEPSRVTIRLTLDQLRGSIRLQTSTRARTQVKFPRVQSHNTSNVHWVEAEGPIVTRSGAQMLATWFSTSRHLVTSYESCFYKGSVPEPDRSVPACALLNAADIQGGNTGLRVSTYPKVASDRGRLFIPAGRIYSPGEGWAPGRFSGALSVRTAAVEGEVGALALWLSF